MSDMFDTHELEDFTKDLLDLANNKMPRNTKKFLNKEGVSLRKVTMSVAQQKTKKRTGNYLKGIKRGKVYRYPINGALSLRVYGGSPHAHLIEYGHWQVVDGKGAGFTKGKHVFETAYRLFQNKYFSDCENFVDEMLEKGLS